METKYVFITGGVISGLGKGITAASLGRLLKNRGYKVAAQKLDPYLNIDPGTMSPYQHGEVFVTEDGAEADLDLGHYERFIDENLNRFSNLTTGKVYWTLLNKERRGDYLGSTVQVIPHVTDEIKTFLYAVGRAAGADVVITEVGGTVGDIESQPFLEAIRQVAAEVGPRNRVFLHVTPLFYVPRSGEVKTKPTQHSVKELQSAGIVPDLIILRSDGPVEEAVREKIALFCNVKKDCVIPNRSVEELYEAPVMLEEAHLSQIVCRELDLDPRILDMEEWEAMLARIRARKGTVTVALVGKYVRLHDAYLSVAEALAHGGYHNGVAVKIRWLESEDLADEAAAEQALAGADGILVPGGFGSRGWRGKSWPPGMPGPTRCPTWASAWGCRLLSSPLPGTCWALPTLTPGNLPWKALTRSSTYSPTSGRICPKGAPCAWGPTPVAWRRAQSCPRSTTAPLRWPSATATGTSLSTPTAPPWRLPVSGWPGPPPTAAWWRP